jgi:hypothetical protein
MTRAQDLSAFAQNVNSSGSLAAVGNISSRSHLDLVVSLVTPASGTTAYTWGNFFNAYPSGFDNGGLYQIFIRETNGAHYNGFRFYLNVGQIGYGSLAQQWLVRDVQNASSGWTGGCGSSSFASIDTNGMTVRKSACFDNLLVYKTKLGS